MSQVLLLQGNALHIPLQDGSVHCCVTSPPYYGLRDYNTGTWTDGDANCTHTRRTSTKEATITTESRPTNTNHEREGWRGGVCGRCGAVRVDAQLGLEMTIEGYLDAMVQVFREVKRVLHNDGTLWLNVGDSYSASGKSGGGAQGKRWADHGADTTGPRGGKWSPPPPGLKEKNLCGIPWRLALALQADGWYLRSEIIWHKPNPMPESVTDRPTRAHEQVFLLSKRARYFYDSEAIQEGIASTPRAQARGPKNTPLGRGPREGGNTGLHAMALRMREGTVSGRNARTVWTLPTEPTPMAHFATFPTALVDLCLRAGTSAYGCCASCGAPWRRAVDRQRLLDGTTPVTGAFSRPDEPFRIPPSGIGHWRYSTVTTEHGWTPTCACSAGTRPCVVFDPFVGSGTSLLVARALGRHGIGLDLSLPYLRDIARQRLGLADLAAWEGRERPREPVGFGDLPLFQEASHD